MNNKENNIKISENGKEPLNNNTKNKNNLKEENKSNTNTPKENEAESEKLSQSLKNLLLYDKDFSSPMIVQKENKLFTDFHYATFKNSYGENTCYINVILHLLYNIEQLQDFLVSLYEIDESNKTSITPKNKNTESESNDNYKFLVLLGNILNQYKDIICDENDEETKPKKNKQVTIINTLRMRKMLEKVSKSQFPLNTIADPVEFFSFILDILNEYLNEDIHKTFYLELIDEYICNKKGCSQINNKYDKDNFMYHIYIDEILKFIEKGDIKVNTFKNKLFEFSHNLFLSENTKVCEKCKEKMEHNLICYNLPDYILINCVWKESNPIVDDAMTVFFMMPIIDEFNNLFISHAKTYKKKFYHLFGFVLYSFTLSHYIICIYNMDKEVFVLLNDEVVKEFHNLYELIIDITVEELKLSGKAFFYPVMLIYTKDRIYKNKSLRINTLNDSEYKDIINKCNEAIYQYEIENKKNEEMEENNYKEFIKEQKEIENEIKRMSRFGSYLRKRKPENKLDIQNQEMKQKVNYENEKNSNNIKTNKIKEEKKVTNEEIKKGLEEKNQITIGKILKEIKKVNGNDIASHLYIGDLMKSHNNFNNEINKGENIDNTIRNRNNKLYQSNIIWNSKTNRENKKEFDENNTKNEVGNYQKRVRFHRQINSDINNVNNLNSKNNLYRERVREVNDKNYPYNSLKRSTQIPGRYHLTYRQDYP